MSCPRSAADRCHLKRGDGCDDGDPSRPRLWHAGERGWRTSRGTDHGRCVVLLRVLSTAVPETPARVRLGSCRAHDGRGLGRSTGRVLLHGSGAGERDPNLRVRTRSSFRRHGATTRLFWPFNNMATPSTVSPVPSCVAAPLRMSPTPRTSCCSPPCSTRSPGSTLARPKAQLSAQTSDRIPRFRGHIHDP